MANQKKDGEGGTEWDDMAVENKTFSPADIPEMEPTVKKGSSDSSYKIIYIFIALLIGAYIVDNIDKINFVEKITTIVDDISQAVPSRRDERVVRPDQVQKKTRKVQESRILGFYQAVSSGQQEKVNQLLPGLQPGEINAVINGMTPVMKAASIGNSKILKLLLDNGADPNKRGSQSRTALQYAAERNQIEAAKILLDHGADINGHDSARLTPLTMAADRRYRDLAMLLIERGADVNIQHVQGWSPLIDAAVSGDLVLVKRLVKAGAKINQATPDGKTAADFARQNRHREVEAFLTQLSQ